jgi:hypothetical protein
VIFMIELKNHRLAMQQPRCHKHRLFGLSQYMLSMTQYGQNTLTLSWRGWADDADLETTPLRT